MLLYITRHLLNPLPTIATEAKVQHNINLYLFTYDSFGNTVYSRFSKSQLFEIPFCPSRCAEVKVIPMMGTQFRSVVSVCTCLPGTTILPLCHFLCVLLYDVTC
jgi:hypothetical protein